MLDDLQQATRTIQEADPRQHHRKQERGRRELTDSLREILTVAEGVPDLEQVLAHIFDQMARVLPFDTASIQLLDPTASALEIIASTGFDDPASVEAIAFPLEDAYPNVRVWRRQMPLRYPDVRELFPHFADPTYHATQVHGWLGAPLVVGDRAIGVITLDSFTPDAYTSEHEHLAMVFAGQAAIAIQNARLFDSARRRIRDLEIVNDIVQIIGTKLDTQDLFKAITSQIADRLQCTHCTLFFPQKEKGELLLVPQVTHGVRGEQIMTRRFKPGEGLAGWVFQQGESLALPDARQDPRFSVAREHRDRPRSMLVAPVKVGDRTIGVISADQDEFGWFSESDRRLVDALARQAGIAIERAAALELLHDIGKRIISSQAVADILQQIVSGAIKLTSTTSGVIYLIGKDGKSVAKSFQYPPEFDHPQPRLASEKGITRQVIATGAEIVFPDIRQDARVNPVLHNRVRSMIAIPLKLDEREVIGVLYLNDAKPHSFTETEVSLLSTLATQAAIAIVNARLLQNTSEALQKRVAEMETLQAVNEAITSTLELDMILDMILDRALQQTKATYGSVQLVSEDGQELLLVITRGADPALIGTRLQFGEGVTGRAAQDGRPYRIGDVQAPEWARVYEIYAAGMRSELAVPMQFEGQVVGVINIESEAIDAFGEDDERLLAGLARQAAIAIQNARLFDSARRRIRDLEIVNDIVQIIGTKLDTQDLLQAIASQIADQLNCTHCTVWFPQDETGEPLLIPQVSYGVRAEQIMTRCFKPGEGLVGWVFQQGESLVLADARQDPRFSPAREDKDRPRSILVAPVKVGDQTIGVISADQEEFGWFSESDRRLVDALARQAGIAIERATALKLVYDIGNQIISEQNVEDILQQIVSGAIRLTNTTAGVIYLINEDGKSVTKSFQYPPDYDLPQPRLTRKKGITRQVIATGEMMVFPDIRLDARVNPVLHNRFRSMIAVPLKLDERKVIGVLYLSDADPHSFTETEISLLSTLATQAAIAIQNAKQYEALCEAQDELLASGAIAWMGLFGSEWSHTVAQKTYSIRSYVDILRDIAADGSPLVRQALDSIDIIAQEIQDVPLVIPSPVDAEKGQPMLIDSLVRKLIEGWCEPHDRVHLELDLRCPGVLVRVDEPLLKMALQKLVDNALRNMPEGGTLSVDSRVMPQEFVTVALQDTGGGIPDEYKPLFGRRRILKPTTDSGSGMGALLARFILRKYNGDLKLAWSEKDEGTRLEITLPICK